MAEGLKNELGLGEPAANAQASAQQGNQFKADFQAQLSKINSDLQYTAAHAEQSAHNSMTTKRQQSIAAYQSALGQIDPTDASKAQSAIDKVLADARALQQQVQTLKQEVEQAFNAWTGREPELDTVADQVREMVDWGHAEADALQQQVESIQSTADLRKWDEAVQALDQLIQELGPIYVEFLRQKEAKTEYESGLPTLESRLADAATCQYASLTAMQEDIVSVEEQMRQAAESQDFVSALAFMSDLNTKLDTYESALAELEEQKQAYETALADLTPRLPTTSSADEALASMETEIAEIQGQMEAAAEAENYEEALRLVTDLGSKVDLYHETVQKRQEYQERVEALLPRIQSVSECEYGQLAELQQGVVDAESLVNSSREAADANDMDTALSQVAEAEGKVDAFEQALEEIEQQRADYEGRWEALQPSVDEALAFTYAPFSAMQASISSKRTEMTNAADQHEYKVALGLLEELNKFTEELFHAIQDEKDRYASEFGAFQSDYDKVFLVAYAYDTLKADRTAIDALKTAADAALEKEDFTTAFAKLKELQTKVTAYNTAAEAEQKQYDDKGAQIEKDLDAAGYLSRDDKAREIVGNLSPEELKHIPTATRIRLMEELKEGVFSDEDKEAVHMLYSVRSMDPEFEALEKQQRRALIESMKSDPEFKEARDNWEHKSEAERLELIQKAVNKTAEAYGVDGVPTVTTRDKAPYEGPNGGIWINNGSYNHGDNEIKINVNTGCTGTGPNDVCPAITNFDDAVELAVHETLHRHQHQLAEGVDDGSIPKDDDRYEQGKLLGLNDDYYVKSKDVGNIYMTQPMETHSRVNEEAIEDAKIGQ